MDFTTGLNVLVICVAAFAYVMVPCALSQDCQHHPQECDAKQVLSNFVFFVTLATSDAETDVYCDAHKRTSLSEDGSTAEYYYVYKNPRGTDRLTDTCTFQAVNNILIYMSCVNYSDQVHPFKLDYVHEDHCFVGHAYLTANSDAQYYLLANVDSDISEYDTCFEKIYGYSNGKVTFMREPEMCENIPLEPQ